MGCLCGLGVWFTAGWLAAKYRPAPVAGEWGQTLIAAGALSAGMLLWGAYVGWRAAGVEQVLAALVITGLLLVISLVDLRVRRIPNALVLGLLAWAGIQVLWLDNPALGSAALGLVVGGGLFGLASLVRRGAMGWGDVKLAAALGAVLGFPLVLWGLLYGVLAGGAAALILLATRRAGRKDYMAYGPYLALGGWLVAMGSLGLW